MHHQQSMHLRQGTPWDTPSPSKDNTETKYFTHLFIQILEINNECEYFRTEDVNAEKTNMWAFMTAAFLNISVTVLSFYLG